MPEDKPFDPLPGFLAEMDQMLKIVPQLARYAKGLFDAFVEQGFTEEQALRLTMNQLKPSS
jgi:hypothetical protein